MLKNKTKINNSREIFGLTKFLQTVSITIWKGLPIEYHPAAYHQPSL